MRDLSAKNIDMNIINKLQARMSLFPFKQNRSG